MGFTFGNSIIPSILPYFNSSNQRLNATATQLATGKRNVPGAKADGHYSFGMKLKATVTERRTYETGIQYGISNTTGAQAQVDAVVDLLDRAVEIATEATDSSLSSGDLLTLDAEYQAIVTSINNIAAQTIEGTTYLSGGTSTVNVASGSTHTVSAGATLTTAGMGMAVANVTDLTSATTALNELTGNGLALDDAIGARARLSAGVQALQNYSQINATVAASLDTTVQSVLNIDVAATISEWIQEQVVQQGQQSVLAQASTLARTEVQFYQRL
jgi:flagellin-like hook-associated protein FlgL